MAFALIFDSVGAGEWVVLLAVLLIVMGPKRLPSALRTFGQYYAKFRRAAESFKRQLLEMDTAIQSEVSKVEQEVEAAARAAEREVAEATKPIDETPAATGTAASAASGETLADSAVAGVEAPAAVASDDAATKVSDDGHQAS